MSKPILNQINLVCGDVNASIAFYRRLGMEIPDAAVWRTPSGGCGLRRGPNDRHRSLISAPKRLYDYCSHMRLRCRHA